MIKANKMSKFGMEMYLKGKAKPTIDHNLPRNPDTSEDLKKVLIENDLLDKFNSWAPSKKRLYIYMLLRAKREETKKKRIEEIVELLL